MEEGLRFGLRVARRVTQRMALGNNAHSTVSWARWCLPSFNPNCDQQLKGHWADADNSCCDTLVLEYREQKTESVNDCPWENPTALVLICNSYGM